MTPPRTTRRGIALLIVLSVLVVLTTAAATLAQLASATKLTSERGIASRLAHDLAAATDTPVRHWLRTRSPRIVLPPDAVSPGIAVLSEQLTLGGHACQIHISAWDQTGMVPIRIATGSSPLRLALPPAAAVAVERRSSVDPVTGLDQFGDLAASVYPHLTDEIPALGALIATHNAASARAGQSPVARINVNTAPLPVVEQAMRQAGRGGLERVVDAREAGKAVPLGALVRTTSGSHAGIQLVGTSDAWAFRVDVVAGTLKRSWWCVYTRDRTAWRCVQRIPIDA